MSTEERGVGSGNTARSGRLGHVVAGVDGSPSARTAALWAAAEAARRGRDLHLVHAADTDRRALFTDAETVQEVREAGRDLLIRTADAVRERFPGLVVTRELGRQEPVAALLAAAGRKGTIVVGHRGLGGFATLMLGSVGLGVAGRAEVPVIVVRGDDERPTDPTGRDGPAHGTVVAAVHDASDLGWLRLAAAEAEARGAALRLVRAGSPFAHPGGAQAPDDLAARIRAAHPGLAVTAHAESGAGAAGILIEASRGADLLVAGRGRRTLALGRALGRVAHALIHHAHCPVEIVPHAFPDTGTDPDRATAPDTDMDPDPDTGTGVADASGTDGSRDAG
ncbi:universal stress protein [Streptomyces sp. NPDC053541]|uniref:universal stress protein n=1 Tax=Streptomyces sp. NPDC053541 TaxID=3365709 RepID=UPI0037D6A229